MIRHVWKVLTGLVVVAVGMLSIGGAALAQEGDGEGTPPPPLPPMIGMFGLGHMHLEVVADTLGMEIDELRAELQAEKTVAEIAEEQGVERETVVDALIEPMEERVAELVEGDYLTDTQADTIVTLLRAMINQGLDRAWTPPMPGDRPNFGTGGPSHQRPGVARIALNIVADTLGMEIDDLHTELQEGKTVAKVAEEQGVALETVVDALIEPISERVQQQVENGRITQEQADERMEMMEENLTERLQQPLPQMPDGFPNGGPDGKRPRNSFPGGI